MRIFELLSSIIAFIVIWSITRIEVKDDLQEKSKEKG